VFVFQPKTRQGAEPDPKPAVPGLYDPDQDVHAAHPEERLERIHGKDAVQTEVNRGGNHANPRKGLRKSLLQYRCAPMGPKSFPKALISG
jgi:hypothetical protein